MFDNLTLAIELFIVRTLARIAGQRLANGLRPEHEAAILEELGVDAPDGGAP